MGSQRDDARSIKPMLGPFELIKPLGQGGGGEVWLGKHRSQETLVAVKIITAVGSTGQSFRARFIEEARAVARLDHPGIVTIFDLGVIEPGQPGILGEEKFQRSPYLVMEYAHRGSLPSIEPIRSYSELRLILLELLNALAHAHARGVIHRDIKPGNVLVTSKERTSPGLKLTDFGIAYPMEKPPRGSALATKRLRVGTPSFMAPEQVRGNLRNQGPWTDLYAIGCLAYRLASGHTPFARVGNDPEQIFQAHLHAIVPPLCSRFALPSGFDSWLDTLLAKPPWQRFYCCAEAIEALKGLGPISLSAKAPALWSPMDQFQQTTEDIFPEGTTITVENVSDDLCIELQGIDAGGLSAGQIRKPELARSRTRQVPVVPESWRHHVTQRRPSQLIGTGLGLFGLRAVPLTARERERDHLWSAFREVTTQGYQLPIVLHGSAGVGKSRLAEWLTERAQELGCADVLKAYHGSFPGASEGVPQMLARNLRCVGLPRHRMIRQVLHILSIAKTNDSSFAKDDLEYHTLALTELMRPPRSRRSDRPMEQKIHFSSQAERYAVIHSLLELKCRTSPVILWFDDVQWGREVLGLAHYLLESQVKLPILMLLTLRDEALRDRPLESVLIKRLLERRGARALEVGPLASNEQLELISGMLSLERDLAVQVQRRTAGNPLFALQLVGDWVARGVLVASPAGFRLRAGEQAELPDNIHDVWVRRIAGLVNHLGGESVMLSLELAAALGDGVNGREWELACQMNDLPSSQPIVAAMLESRLAYRTELGWTFGHTMLRESLERTARGANRWSDHQRTCAAMLQKMYEHDLVGVAERVARHLQAAGDQSEALQPLLLAAEQREGSSDFDRAFELCQRFEQILVDLGVPRSDPRFSRVWLLKARCRYGQADFEAVEELLTLVEQELPENSPSHNRATVYKIRAQLTRMGGDMRDAVTWAEKSSVEFQGLHDMVSAAECDTILARLHMESTGDHRRGLALASDALETFKGAQDMGNLAECHYIMGHLRLALGDVEGAQAAVDEARHLHEQRANRFGIAVCANFDGELARFLGDYELAEAHYRKTVSILRSIGSMATFVPRLNLAIAMVQAGSTRKAEPLLKALQREGRAGKHAVLCFIHYGLMVCRATDRSWVAWDEEYESAMDYRPESGRVDQDLALMAQSAGELALSAGERERARKSFQLALEHWTALEKSQEVEKLRELMEQTR